MKRYIKLSVSGFIAFFIWGISGYFSFPVGYGILWFGIGMPLTLALLIFVAHHERS